MQQYNTHNETSSAPHPFEQHFQDEWVTLEDANSLRLKCRLQLSCPRSDTEPQWLPPSQHRPVWT